MVSDTHLRGNDVLQMSMQEDHHNLFGEVVWRG